ncbi:MAG TPA: prepilin peptidase [Blastocatellia bacterium]|nr:prepilin peptidase [Blastocatellia bacterium]
MPVAELPFAFYAIAAFVFGLLVGSFLNVIIWRVPRGESIVFPGSHCGSCGASVRPYDNIPLISYAVLRGKCRACKTKISFVYPAVELLTGLLFLAVIFKSGPTWAAVTEVIFVALMISLTFIDAKHQLLPNVITYPALLFAICAGSFQAAFFSPYAIYFSDTFAGSFVGRVIIAPLLVACAIPAFQFIDRMDDVLFGKYFETDEAQAEPEAESDKQIHEQHQRVTRTVMIIGFAIAITLALIGIIPGMFLNPALFSELFYAALGALIGGGIIWLLRAAYFYARGFEGMGLGDVKLMAVIGAFLGWQSAILVIVIGSLLGSIVGLVLARKSEDGMKTAMPFGVFLAPAAILALFFGHSIIQWYAGRFS